MKRSLGYRQSFRSLEAAQAIPNRIETMRTIKRGYIRHKLSGVGGESGFSI
ncbi:hypothetical protein AAD018_017875 [Aestuariibius insulae]|uniref:hypothetical protein n=1 Tax=Aestuariibius insulae TaxID=2058287 RepID=UPI00345E6457